MSELHKQPACSEKIEIIHRHELPLSCPTDEMILWNAHPKVYLPILEEKQVVCPYCSTRYILQDDA